MNNKNVAQLPPIYPDKIPNILLLGNGITQSFTGVSWESVITNTIEENNCPYSYDKIKALPANMQIVVASGNEVQKSLDKLRMPMYKEISKEQKEFLNLIVTMPVTDFLTTNYDYNIEQAAGIQSGVGHFQNCRRWTKEVKDNSSDKLFNLYQFSSVNCSGTDKRVWHIHGDICVKKSLVMGHHHYGCLTAQIVTYISGLIKQYKSQISKYGYYIPQSWVDYFVIGNVYSLGLAFHLTETDLWWLLDYKQRHFPNSTLHYFQPAQDINRYVEIMLKTYDVDIRSNVEFIKESENNYINYYIEALKQIKNEINNVQNSK